MRNLHDHAVRSVSSTGVFARLGVAALVAGVGLAPTAQAKPFMDYLKPAPITCAPLSSATWGVAGVLPRDTCNGIESAKGAGVPPEYYYWDGQIIPGKDGSFHLFMSTWSGRDGFNPGWTNSESYHAVSTGGVLGPYQRKGYIWSSGSHKGHNTSALELPDGSYAVVVSEVVPFTIYKSASLDGPWTPCTASIQANGVNAGSDQHYDSNVSLVARHDGKFQIVQRHGLIAVSDTLCGPYKMQKPTWSYPAANRPTIDSIYPRRTSIPGVSNPTYAWEEDPHIWYSGGVYHVIYAGSGDRVGWHLYSSDGIHDWKDNGLAFGPRSYQKIFCYEGSSTCNQWYKMERPGVLLQNGRVTHITWSVADVDKDNQIPAGSNHGSKIIVVPFDGVTFDSDFGTGSGGTGTGGAGSSGGTSASGGASSGGRSNGGGGNTSTGGAQATGGVTAQAGGNATTGGAAGSSLGGQTASSGGTSSALGGTASTLGGTSSTFGGSGSGGASFGGAASGGLQALGGRISSGGAVTSAGTAAADPADASGCGCRTAGERAPSKSAAIVGLLGILMLRRRKRQNRR